MKKIKCLIFIGLILISLLFVSFAYNVGDVVTARISGYCKNCNQGRGDLTTVVGYGIVGETAAVSYTGSTRNPDLKYGTVVYIESQGKSYVINDVGSSKQGASIGVEPVCNDCSEEPWNLSSVKILYVPNEGSIQKNYEAGLNFLRSNGANNTTNITATNICTAEGCGGVLSEEYYLLGKIHYRVCANNNLHHNDFKDHKTDGTCEFCKKSNTVVPSGSGATVINKCYVCGELIIDKWLDRSGINHYKACANGHELYVEGHKWDAENICTVCKFGKKNITQFEKLDSVTKDFSDLPSDHWAYNEVMEMVNAGIASGRTDGTFGTNDKITAEEFLVLVMNLMTKKGLFPSSDGSVFLATQMKDQWSHDAYVTLAKILGAKSGEIENLGATEIRLILGNSEEEVMANYKKPITREKAANILGVFIDMKDTEISSTNELGANDWNEVNSIYRKRINLLAKKNIFKGVLNADGSISINPNVELTRVQAVSLINRLYNAL